MNKLKCPYCTNERPDMIEKVYESKRFNYYHCQVCSKRFVIEKESEK